MEEWLEREKIYACWLCNFPDMGNRQMLKLLELCGSVENIYFADRGKWAQMLTEKQLRSLAEYTEKWKPKEEYRKMTEQGIGLLAVWQKDYPQSLKDIPDPPLGLFVRGKLPEMNKPAVAVIGARDCSEYGRFMAAELGTALGKAGVTVVSGMARGVDGIAQTAALEAGGTSIAVLGNGVDVCYPSQNRNLYNELLSKGAVVSSYPLGMSARPQNFPARNRIVSGLADAVIVVEARAKSGTLITVDTGLEQGKEIYAVPGRITDRLSDGCNFLIKQGAGMILSPKVFLDELWEIWERKRGNEQGAAATEGIAGQEADGENARKVQRAMRYSLRKYKGEEDRVAAIIKELPPELAAIYSVLDATTPKSSDEICAALPKQKTSMELSTQLMKLCMEKRAVQVTPGQFCRVET